MPVEFRNVDVHSTWKIFPRHPAGADYLDLSKKVAQRMREGIERYGVMLRPVVLKREQGGMCVLDGWQMYQQCIAADVKPEFVELVNGIDASEYVSIKNDHRRHETAKERSKRILARKTVARKSFKDGKTRGEIAEDLGVSTTTVGKDLHLPRCERCISVNSNGDDCVKCQLLRIDEANVDGEEEKTDEPQTPDAPPVPEPPRPVHDANFVVVPDHVLEAFLAAGEIGHLCHEIDGIIKRLNKLLNAKVGTRSISPTLPKRISDIRTHLWQTRPTYVCPYCQGKETEVECTACRGQGWQSTPTYAQAPKEFQDEMRRIGSRNVPI